MNDDTDALPEFGQLPETTGQLKIPPTILVVDDEPMFGDLYRSLIEQAFKIARIFVFHDGDAAWHQIEQHAPQLIISDLLRPGMDGYEMLQRLAQKNASPPIMIVSGALPEKESVASRGNVLSMMLKIFSLNFSSNFLAYTGPMPLTMPLLGYVSMPFLVVGAVLLSISALNCGPKQVLVNRKARVAETIQIKAKTVVKFRVAKAAKDAILGVKK
jgi:CheY-like chemotaxis protein